MANQRTPEQQKHLNVLMRRRDVKEYLVSEALRGTTRASAEHTKRFLELAPPEFHVLLEELLPDTSAPVPRLPRDEEPLVPCLVGMLAEKNLDRILLDLSRS